MTATAFRIAVREARSSRGKFLFVIIAVALGVGSLVGVRGFSQAFASMLLTEARTMMAADVSVRIFGDPSPEQENAIARLEQRKVRATRVTETLSMVSAAASPDPLLVTLKAVDPQQFPFYGSVTLSPSGQLKQILKADSVVISEDARLRLKASPGDTVRIGGQEFRVAGIVTAEPDRMSGSFTVGPRVMVSREGLDRTGLMKLGSRASNRLLLKLTPGSAGVTEVRAELAKVFPDALITDFRESNPNIARGLSRATTFLSLVSLIALIIGAIGVSTSMHAHLQQKMDTIATLKSLGARSSQVVRIYLIQTALLGLCGGIAGVLVGMGVQRIFPELIERYFHMRPEAWFSPASATQGLMVGLLTTLLFTLPPLLNVRKIKPALILRREMPGVRGGWRQKLRDARVAIFAGVVICCGLAGIAAWLIDGSWRDAARVGGYFVGGLLVSLSLLYGVAAVLLKLLQIAVTRIRMPVTARHALANLYRPGSQARSVLTALGVGVMFTLTIFLIQRSVLAEIRRSAPPGMANVFFIDITREQRDPLLSLIASQQGTEGKPEALSAVSAKIVAVNGTPIEQLKLTGFGRRYRFARTISTFESRPAGRRLRVALGGMAATRRSPFRSSSPAASRSSRDRESPGTRSARRSTFASRVSTRPITSGCTRWSSSIRILELSTICRRSTTLPLVFGTPQIAALQRASYERFPTVTVINVADLLDRVQEVVDQIALVIRFISAFSILAGAIILASSIAGTRFRRVREIVIFKTLGATRATVARMFSIEFLVLGMVAGLMGSLLATGFSSLLLKRFFDAPFAIDLAPNVVAVLATALIAAASGWLASFRILGQKPLEILRGE